MALRRQSYRYFTWSQAPLQSCRVFVVRLKRRWCVGLLALPSAPIPTPPNLSARLPLFHIRIVTTFFSLRDNNERIYILDAIRRRSTAATDLIWTRRDDVAMSTQSFIVEKDNALGSLQTSPTCADQVRYGGNRAASQHQAAMFQKIPCPNAETRLP
jgi:hypothetical protein